MAELGRKEAEQYIKEILTEYAKKIRTAKKKEYTADVQPLFSPDINAFYKLVKSEDMDLHILNKLNDEGIRQLLNDCRRLAKCFELDSCSIQSAEDACKAVDYEAQILAKKLAEWLVVPLQQGISTALNTAGDFCLNHNKVYFLGIPWLVGKGFKKGSEALAELDIPDLAGNIVFTENVLNSLCDKYFSEDGDFKKKIINDSIKLNDKEQTEIKKFIKSDNYEFEKNEILFKINIDELNKINLPGLIYNGSKKFDYSFSSSINTSGLGDFATLKSAPADYVFNLIQKEILRADIGINAGKIGNFANSFSINLFDEKNNTAKPFSFLIKDLTKLWSYSTLEKLEDAINTTDAGITNVSTYNKDNLALSLGGTFKHSGLGVIGGVQYENNNFATTNIVTLEQGEDKKLTKIDVKNQFNTKKNSDINVVLGQNFISSSKETEIKKLCLYSGISLNFSELDKKLSGQGEDEAIKDVLLRFGVTYTRNYVEQKNGYKISTDFKCSAFDGTINVGLVVDSSEIKNNKMKISYEYRGK